MNGRACVLCASFRFRFAVFFFQWSCLLFCSPGFEFHISRLVYIVFFSLLLLWCFCFHPDLVVFVGSLLVYVFILQLFWFCFCIYSFLCTFIFVVYEMVVDDVADGCDALVWISEMCSLATAAAAVHIVLCVPEWNWVCSDGFCSIWPNEKAFFFVHSATNKNRRMNCACAESCLGQSGLVWVCECAFRSFWLWLLYWTQAYRISVRTITKLFKLNRLAYVRIWFIDQFRWRLDTVNVPQEVCQMNRKKKCADKILSMLAMCWRSQP